MGGRGSVTLAVMANKSRKPTLKQTKLIKGIISGKTKTQAALDAGYGKGKNAASAAVQANGELKNPKVQAAFELALEEAGLSLPVLAQEVKRGLARGKMGNHDSYLKIALNGRGALKDPEEGPKVDRVSLAILILDERRKRGLPIDV